MALANKRFDLFSVWSLREIDIDITVEGRDYLLSRG